MNTLLSPDISVIICTHNPRLDYIERVLNSIRLQTLSKDKWELLLIDNASNKVLAEDINLSWHPFYRHIREEKLGLTFARIRGIQEAKAQLLIFVDDDNVLADDYLEESLRILNTYPFLGAFGGSIIAETEGSLEAWQKPYLSFLAVREVNNPVWGNISFDGQNVPYGAGMCIRCDVGNHYSQLVQNNSVRIFLDRRGNLLSSAGDTDLALTAFDCGYATGLFPSLKLTHLIPKKRLDSEYLLRLKREGGASGYILDYIRSGNIPDNSKKSIVSNFMEKIRSMKLTSFERRMRQAEKIARNLALQEIIKIQEKQM